jgi:hypothetical protein
VDRKRAVVWASGISVSIVLGSGLLALGAGAFAEPPVDHVGSFESINTQLSPGSTTTRPLSAPASTTTRGPGASAVVPSTSADVAEPPTSAEAESHEPSTTVRAGTTTTDDGAREPPREPPEHEAPDD